MKTKSILSNHMVMLPAIFITFAGYFLSMYRGNSNLASNYSLLIIALPIVCIWKILFLAVKHRRTKALNCWHMLTVFY